MTAGTHAGRVDNVQRGSVSDRKNETAGLTEIESGASGRRPSAGIKALEGEILALRKEVTA